MAKQKLMVHGWDRIFKGSKRTIRDIINDPKARECGLGYEEWVKNFLDRSDIPKDKPWLLHNENCYDEYQFSKTDGLKCFIKENFFLPKEVLDYEKVEVVFKKK